MRGLEQYLIGRVSALAETLDGLGGLRKVLNLPPAVDLFESQWIAIESSLHATRMRLRGRLDRAHRAYVRSDRQRDALISLNEEVGSVNYEVSEAHALLDMYLDILTPRLALNTGRLLAACDSLADASLRREHTALETAGRPVVFWDRGFGASIIREGTSLDRVGKSPLPLIQIPYVKLTQKYGLGSIVHEVGHEASHRLDMVTEAGMVLGDAAASTGSSTLAARWASWSSEIVADYWGFGCLGAGQAASIREILLLPRALIFRMPEGDPHPPPYIRVLLSIALCRGRWGRGPWDQWEKEWIAAYPVPRALSAVIGELTGALPSVANALHAHRFSRLGRRALPDIFDLRSLSPTALGGLWRQTGATPALFWAQSPTTQLALFRHLLDVERVPVRRLQTVMTAWLMKLPGQVQGEEQKCKTFAA